MAVGNFNKLKFELVIFLWLFCVSEGGIYMDQQAKEIRNRYMREWRAKNKDKVKAAQNRYWEKKSKKHN